MYLVANYKINELIQQREDYNWKLAQIGREIDDLRQYGESIAGSTDLFGSLFTTPGSMYGRHLYYMNYSSAYAEAQANQQMNNISQLPQHMEQIQKYQNDPQALANYMNSIKNYFVQQAKQQFARHESLNIHNREKALLNQQKHYQDSLTSIEKQITWYQGQADSGAESIFNSGGKGRG